MNQNVTPLFDALLKYRDKQLYSFHVPGHKDGLTIPHQGKSVYKSILGIDATEVYGLDDLYEPDGVIAEAQELLKDLYKTVKSFFLVNGSTVGNLVMVLSACRSGDKVLVQRDSHKSIFNALKLANVHPIFLSPDIDDDLTLPMGLNKQLVQKAIDGHPDAKALILTYPNYYGIAKEEYKEIVALAKNKGLLVLVDEAHGAHFILEKPVPESTLEMGADIVVHSAHKTLPAMTMGSYLHINSEKVSLFRIEQVLEALQTSSPSYPIMASLDLARAYLASIDRDKQRAILDNLSIFKEQLIGVGLNLLKIRDGLQDPFKILLKSDQNGFLLQECMQRAGLYPEMADPNYVLLTLAIDEKLPSNQLVQAFKSALNHFHSNKNNTNILPGNSHKPTKSISTLSVTYADMERLAVEKVDMENLPGRISAQMVMPYPPGVPVVLEGEMLTNDHIGQIRQWQKVGARFHGLHEGNQIAVYKTSE